MESVVLLSIMSVLPLQQQAPPDSMKAVRRAESAIHFYYRDHPPVTRNCRGEFLTDCRQGDWDCVGWQCQNPRTPERRAELMDRLDEWAVQAGANDFLYGQRVAFAVKHGAYERAAEIAAECSGRRWWCLALRGFAAHNRAPGAGIAQFDSAMWYAPRATRCHWNDLDYIKPPELLRGYRRLSCEQRAPLERRFWFLTDPLWSDAGNLRYAEHMARHVAVATRQDMLAIAGSYIRYDHLRLLIRNGFPNSYRSIYRVYEQGGTAMDISGLNGYVQGGYRFVPGPAQYERPLESTADDWKLERNPIWERMSTRQDWYNLAYQTAVFRRGDQLLMMAAAQLPADLPAHGGAVPFLAVGRMADLRTFRSAARWDGPRTLRGSIRVDSAQHVMSIEVVGDEFHARARHGAPTPALENGFGLSDIALVDERFEREEMDVVDALLPSQELDGRTRVGLYFEVYGIGEEEAVRITLAGERTNRSVLRRITGALGLSSEPIVRVSWQEQLDTDDAQRVQRFVMLDLAGLASGDNEVVVTVQRADNSTARAARVFTVVR